MGGPCAGTYTIAQNAAQHCLPRARTIGFPRHELWERMQMCTLSILDLSFQCSHWESLHNRLGWLCLDFDFLTKYVPHPCFGCWLCSGLDAAQAWNSENARLFHLLCGPC